MTFNRPSVPSRGFEVFAFGASGLMILGLFGVFLLAAIQGKIPWTDIPGLLTLCPLIAAPTITIGLLCRWFRIRKLAALREYERVLDALTKA